MCPSLAFCISPSSTSTDIASALVGGRPLRFTNGNLNIVENVEVGGLSGSKRRLGLERLRLSYSRGCRGSLRFGILEWWTFFLLLSA